MMEVQHDELVRIELDMLKEVMSICKKHGLLWFLIAGSALGAVRHKGFIPWDDDIDIALPRKDYERFLIHAQEELPEPFFLQTFETEPDYRHAALAKIRNSNTAYVESTSQTLHINHGVFIDIFPIDGYPGNRISQKLLRIKRAVINSYLGKDYGGTLDLKNKIMIALGKLMYGENVQKAARKLAKIFSGYDYDTCDLVVLHDGAYGDLEICRKEQFGKGIPAEFEGMEVKIPELYDEYLRQKYNDYMEFPPEEKRVPHHYTIIISTERSYKDFLETDEKGRNVWKV